MTTMPGPTKLVWFSGPAAALGVLREAAAARGITLRSDVPPSLDEAQALEEELADVLIAKGFEGDWELTRFGGLVEDLIDALSLYVHTPTRNCPADRVTSATGAGPGVTAACHDQRMSEYSWLWENDKYQAANAAAAWTETVRTLPVGTAITGEVIGCQPFGAFLAIDGHPDALGLARVNLMPGCLELPTVGQHVTGEVFWHADHNHQVGIMLSEWARHEDLLPRFAQRVGQVVTGRVTEIVPIGVFVRLADCVGGLVPLTELSESAGDDPAEAVREGEEVSVQILAVDLERSRIILSAKRVA